MKYLESGIFKVMITLYEKTDWEHIEMEKYKEIARTLEFCSTHNDGIKLLFSHKAIVFKLLKQFF
jgi:hypothetical protein